MFDQKIVHVNERMGREDFSVVHIYNHFNNGIYDRKKEEITITVVIIKC